MRLQHEIGEALVTWRMKAGHRDGGKWVTDDAPGERTGPFGKTHMVTEDQHFTWCGKEVPDGAEFRESAPLDRMCHTCLRLLVKPCLP